MYLSFFHKNNYSNNKYAIKIKIVSVLKNCISAEMVSASGNMGWTHSSLFYSLSPRKPLEILSINKRPRQKIHGYWN